MNLPPFTQFLRFLDTLKDSTNQDAPEEIHRIYNIINSLTEDELTDFLTEHGKNMSDTCEFNFYGAYRIDFDLIHTIKSIGENVNDTNTHYTINFPEFILELQKGNIKKFSEAKQAMPNLFQSSRFIEYLRSKATHPDATAELLESNPLTL
ncbi:MAG: hypothetical protein M3R00_03610 [Pseudomonadota bacterium]|nr:hypothetical protein [Pseudomonadota bacterium]